jgi:hypothetical protein
MAFLKVYDERIGHRRKFVSEKAIRDYIAKLQRGQKRLLDGTTLAEPLEDMATTPSVCQEKRLSDRKRGLTYSGKGKAIRVQDDGMTRIKMIYKSKQV